MCLTELSVHVFIPLKYTLQIPAGDISVEIRGSRNSLEVERLIYRYEFHLVMNAWTYISEHE